ncbi:MAG TPA: hypothetical protein VKX39_01905 [Bryobacteraceae bacterium]|jgi:hypothetical protein|nr:hypothetical protein [Bryobacteraceae bacterium]
MLIAFAIYRIAPELPDLWRDTFGEAAAKPVPAVSKPAPVPKASVAPRAKAAPQQSWKTTTIDDSTPPPQPAPEATDSPAVTPAPSENDPASPDDPYDSGVKRGIKRIGRFLHIGGKKNNR